MKKKLFGRTIIVFALVCLINVLLITAYILNKLNIEKLNMEQLILEQSSKANESLSRILFKTQTLSVLAENGYTAAQFDQIAATLIDDPAILNVLIAPDGVVSNVYPLAGNEALVGSDFYSAGEGNKEAIQAKETKQLVLGGPFDSIQGEQVIVGRLPVFQERKDGREEFWGLISITLKYPDILESVGLNDMQLKGYDYEIWRYNPDDGQKQIISEHVHSSDKQTRYIDKAVTVQNAEWIFRIYSTQLWYEYPDIWFLIIGSLLISLLIAFVVQNYTELKQLKLNFEILSYTDALTGIYNRRYFMEYIQNYLDRIRPQQINSALIMLDIDYFKKVNDRFGHLAGDQVLKNVAATVQRLLRSCDFFGRYGGEEFIIFLFDLDEAAAIEIAERIRSAIAKELIRYEHYLISVSASLGIAKLDPEIDLQTAIRYADQALYTAKNEGRNQVVSYYKETLAKKG